MHLGAVDVDAPVQDTEKRMIAIQTRERAVDKTRFARRHTRLAQEFCCFTMAALEPIRGVQ
jgi:hypothetical protein